mmetsp:Transcript_25235/g.84571  ORF Transcript_25235/g.84571 Transcript_25235/m.84571 type:complete len:246 (-) Transcript_25235:381-1118(-)
MQSKSARARASMKVPRATGACTVSRAPPPASGPRTATRPESACTATAEAESSAVKKSMSVLAAPRERSTSAPSTYSRTGLRDMAPAYTPAQMVPPSSRAVLPWRVVATGTRSTRANRRTPAWALRRCTSTPARSAGRSARVSAATTCATASAQACSSCVGRTSQADARPAGGVHGAAATSIGSSMSTGRLSRMHRRRVSSMSSGAFSASRSTTDAPVTGLKAACCACSCAPTAWCGSASGGGSAT